MTTTAADILSDLLKAIADHELMKTHRLIDTLNLSQLPPNPRNQIIALILQVDRSLVNLIEAQFPALNYSFAISLLANSSIKDEDLAVLMKDMRKDSTSILIELFNFHQDDNVIGLAERMTKIMPPSTDEIRSLQKMISICDDDEDINDNNPKLRQLINSFILTPEWIVEKELPILPTVPMLPPHLHAAKMLKNYTEINLSQQGAKIKFNQVLEHYMTLSDSDKYQILKPIYNWNVSDVEVLFREFGPVNPQSNMTEGICSQHGGCRMLLCNEFTPREDDTDIEVDWFTGECDICHHQITKRHHSLRLPLRDGGWFGCFCSSKCLDKQNHGLILEELTVADDCLKYGIRDR